MRLILISCLPFLMQSVIPNCPQTFPVTCFENVESLLWSLRGVCCQAADDNDCIGDGGCVFQAQVFDNANCPAWSCRRSPSAGKHQLMCLFLLFYQLWGSRRFLWEISYLCGRSLQGYGWVGDEACHAAWDSHMNQETCYVCHGNVTWQVLLIKVQPIQYGITSWNAVLFE